MSSATTETCQYCGEAYVVPEGKKRVRESTCDIEPPARSAVYAIEPDQRLPDWDNVLVIHYCEKGHAKCLPGTSHHTSPHRGCILR